MYDAIIVGARCAGSPTAMLLAQKGYKILLTDKAEFPSNTMSSHFIHIPGIVMLKRWGLLDKVISSNCPPIEVFNIDFGPITLQGSPQAIDGVTSAYGPRRTIMDKILVDAAVAAGAELREGFAVDEILMEGNKVTGIRGHEKNGKSITEKASIVVGADGLHSLVANSVGAVKYNEKPSVTCSYYTYWSDVPLNGVELYTRLNQFIVAFPTNDDLICTLIQWKIEKFPEVKADIESHFHKALALAPNLAKRISNGQRAERFYGSADLPNFFRKPYGNGWSLVGNAGLHMDPNGAHGISDAFRDAELLADAIDKSFSGKQQLNDAMEEYERKRNENALPLFELNFQFATLEPPPQVIQNLVAALHNNKAETERFLGAIVGTVPIPEFFAPANIERIISTINTV